MNKYCDIFGTFCLLGFFVSLLFLGGAIDADKTIWPWLGTFAASIIGCGIFGRAHCRVSDCDTACERFEPRTKEETDE